jgi:NAD(P)-dependent dehydrogenase (short-subunit alcohol dehydrogenase family)
MRERAMQKGRASEMSRFKGQVALVTGSGRGIGKATALKFAEEGAFVLINDLHEESVNEVVAEIQSLGGNAAAAPFDITDRSGAAKAVEQIVKDHGSVDVLVNNAGGENMQPAESYASWDRVIGVNLSATFFMSQAVANASMIPNKRGAIVNLSSLAGLAALPNDVGYTAAKHGVVGLTKALGVEWAKYGIRVNAVSPGMSETPASLAWKKREPEAFEERIARVPWKRMGRAEEQADAILFLASEDASFITGLTIPVDGGQMALNPGHSMRRK